MRRMISAVLVALLALAACAPVTGEEGLTHGFQLVEIGRMDHVDADTALYEHVQSGAQVLHVKNGDTNRAFTVAFHTPFIDSSGEAHIIEHLALSGSQKYPSPTLFLSLGRQTYQTYMNAGTYMNETTVFPCASLSEKQLLKLADYYMAGVLEPLVYEDERVFKREAWRYELRDPEAPIALNGTVYNEMRGAWSINYELNYANLAALYPGSRVARVSGGRPSDIPDLSWEELKAYHRSRYHPSGALIMLYGDLDVEPFLEMLNRDYLSKYQREERVYDDPDYVPLEEYAFSRVEYPVEMGFDADGGAAIAYGIVLPGLDERAVDNMEVLLGALLNPASPLKQAVAQALPGAVLGASLAGRNAAAPSITFTVTGVREDQAEDFRAAVDGALKQVAREGLDERLVEASAASLRLQMELGAESKAVGVNLLSMIAQHWAASGDVTRYGRYIENVNAFAVQARGERLRLLAERYLADNPRRALTVVVPTPGLAERRDAQLRQELADLKEGMSEEQIHLLVQKTLDFDAWVAQPIDDAEAILALRAVDVQTLPEEAVRYEVVEEELDGVRCMTALAPVDEALYARVLLDVSSIPPEDLPYYMLLVSLTGTLPTERYSMEELGSEVLRYLSGASVEVLTADYPDGRYTPYLSVAWLLLEEDAEPSFALLRELLLHGKLTNEQLPDIRKALSQALTNRKASLNRDNWQYLMNRAMSGFHETAAYVDALTGFGSYEALKAVERELNEAPEPVLERLRDVQARLNNRQGAVLMLAGSEEGIALGKAGAQAFYGPMPAHEVERADYSGLSRQEGAEATVIDAAVSTNVLLASLEELGLEFEGELNAMALLVYDQLLLPVLRYQNGAYSVKSMVNRYGLSVASVRDPNIRETYRVFDELGDGLEEIALTLTQAQLDGYIMAAYSEYALNGGALSGASNALWNRLEEADEDYALVQMRGLKSLKLDRLKGYADVYRKLSEKGYRATAGSASAIEACADLFDKVRKPLAE